MIRTLRAAAAALVTCASFVPGTAWAQGFGQNKITYEQFDWKVYPSPHFDVHYYPEEEIFLEEVVSYAESAYLQISKKLDHELRVRVPLVIYKTHADFEQTNITLSELPQGVAAFAEPIQNRMVLPIDLPPSELYELIAHELAHIFQYSIFYEGYVGRALRSNAPTWLMEGMASYLAEDEDNLDRMALRDAVVNNILPPVQALNVLSFLTYRYGHAIFDYMEREHGIEGVRTFIYEFRKVLLTGNIEKAIQEAFGYDVEEFNRRFARYLQKQYLPVLLEKSAPEDYGEEIGFEKPGIYTFSPTVSPSGELVAALASPKLELDLVVLTAEEGSRVRNLTKGWTNRYRQLVTQAFEGKRDLSWSPTGDEIAVFARRENTWPLLLYDAIRGRLLREIQLPELTQNGSPAFSPDGKRIAFEGNRNGVVDLFEVDLATLEVRNLTQDDAFDANPWYAADGRTLLYNRQLGDAWKIYSVDLSDPQRKSQLTFGPTSELQPSLSRDGTRVYFTSDAGPEGIFNIHSLELATGTRRQHTDVIGGCFAPVEMAPRGGEPQLVFVSYFEGTFRLFRMPLRGDVQPAPTTRPAGGEAAEPDRDDRVPAGPATAPGRLPVDDAPFEPPLQLRVDEERKRPYRLAWSLEAPSVAVGVADDGTLLTSTVVQFSDLLGDHRAQVIAQSVSSFSNLSATYVNLKRRTHWGASIFDTRDYFLSSFGDARERIQRSTGATVFLQYPFSRYYRVDGGVGVLDRSQDFLSRDLAGNFFFTTVSDRFAIGRITFTGDTTRYQSFGPFQGKRFSVSTLYGHDIGSDLEGSLLEYSADLRTYSQLTRRSLVAWRLAGIYSAGDRESYTSLGGVNQLRGFEFREFFGSRVVWTNLELRFPLVDEMRFPFGSLRAIRGFLFADAGAAWFADDTWYDPDSPFVPIRVNPPFDVWDSENDRLQDARASYGAGLQFFFGGLQLNWAWAKRVPYTRFVPLGLDPVTGEVVYQTEKADVGGTRTEFYIVFDF